MHSADVSYLPASTWHSFKYWVYSREQGPLLVLISGCRRGAQTRSQRCFSFPMKVWKRMKVMRHCWDVSQANSTMFVCNLGGCNYFFEFYPQCSENTWIKIEGISSPPLLLWCVVVSHSSSPHVWGVERLLLWHGHLICWSSPSSVIKILILGPFSNISRSQLSCQDIAVLWNHLQIPDVLAWTVTCGVCPDSADEKLYMHT